MPRLVLNGCRDLCLWSQGVDESGYRELLLDTQMLRQDLEKTLADKQRTMVRWLARKCRSYEARTQMQVLTSTAQ
jgi:hypothetical protein